MTDHPDPQPFRIWGLHCPFSKTGFPVVGSFGSTERAVIVMTTETWTRLCEAVPALKTMEFEVGVRE